MYQVDEQLAVRFPKPPQEVDVAGTMAAKKPETKDDPMVQTSQAYVAQDAFARYVLVKISLPEPPKFPASFEERSAYYRSRTIPLLAGQNEVEEQQIFQMDGVDVIGVKLRMKEANGRTQARYIQIVTIGSTVYQLHFSPLGKKGEKATEQRAAFFRMTFLKQAD